MKKTNVINFSQLLLLTKQRKSDAYFGGINKFKHCFTGDIKQDVRQANSIIDMIVNNNTAHSRQAMFKGAYDRYYGIKFNAKYLHERHAEISKFTTRLDKYQVSLIRIKFNEGINDVNKIIKNGQENLIKYRKRIQHVFESLLCSGMRVGELCSINFSNTLQHRIITSPNTGNCLVEIIINTKKTCKKREIYLPVKCYQGFCQDSKKLKRELIVQGFINFSQGADLPFKLTSHVLRRTKASLMHEAGVDIPTIALTLGHTVKTCMNHYIISSARNFDACDIANALVDGKIEKYENMFMNTSYLQKV